MAERRRTPVPLLGEGEAVQRMLALVDQNKEEGEAVQRMLALRKSGHRSLPYNGGRGLGGSLEGRTGPAPFPSSTCLRGRATGEY